MKRQPILDFFDISSNVEELPRNELFRLRGGYSDGTIDGGELPGVDVPPPPGIPDPDDDPWGWDRPDPLDDRLEGDNSDSRGWSDTGGWSDYGGGSGGGGMPIYTPPPANDEGDTENNDPWERDEDGNLVMTKTGEKSHIDYRYEGSQLDSIILYFDEVLIKDSNGNDIKAYKVSMYQDSEGAYHDNYDDIPGHYKSNCHGYAMGLDLWISDIENTGADGAYKTMMETYESSKDDATVISFYHGSQLTHSIRTDPNTGEVWSTTDHGVTQHFNSMDDFFDYSSDGKPENSNGEKYKDHTQKYYNPY